MAGPLGVAAAALRSPIVRKLVVEIGVSGALAAIPALVSYTSGADQAEQSTANLGSAASVTQFSMLGLAAAVLGSAGILARHAVSAAQTAGAIDQLSQASGESAKSFQELAFVFGEGGASADQASAALFRLRLQVADALDGSENAAAAFNELGIAMAQLRGQSPGRVLELIADRMSRATDATKALRQASLLLGEGLALQLAPTLRRGAEGIRELRREAGDLGIAVRDDALAAGQELSAEWRRLGAAARALSLEIGLGLAPIVKDVVNAVVEWVKANRDLIRTKIEQFMRALRSAFDLLARPLGTLLALFGGLALLLTSIPVLVGSFLLVAANPLLATFLALATAITSVLLLLDDFAGFLEGKDSVFGRAIQRIEMAVGSFLGLSDAVGSVRRTVDSTVDSVSALVEQLVEAFDASRRLAGSPFFRGAATGLATATGGSPLGLGAQALLSAVSAMAADSPAGGAAMGPPLPAGLSAGGGTASPGVGSGVGIGAGGAAMGPTTSIVQNINVDAAQPGFLDDMLRTAYDAIGGGPK